MGLWWAATAKDKPKNRFVSNDSYLQVFGRQRIRGMISYRSGYRKYSSTGNIS